VDAAAEAAVDAAADQLMGMLGPDDEDEDEEGHGGEPLGLLDRLLTGLLCGSGRGWGTRRRAVHRLPGRHRRSLLAWPALTARPPARRRG
jgi:hypothetical protein